MATDTRKVVLGSLLLVASTILILGPLGVSIPAIVTAAAALGMAAGALLVGTSEDGRPV